MDAKTAADLLATPSLQPVTGNLSPATNSAVATVTATNLSPLSDAEKLLSETPNSIQLPDAVRQTADLHKAFREANEEPGIPLDIESGADTFTRMGVSFRRKPEDQIAYLQQKFGQNAVRKASDGTPIVRVLDPKTNQPKDLLVQEQGVKFGDLADIVGQSPEIIVGALMALRGNPTAFRSVLKMAAGSEAAGAIKDVATRALDSQPIQPGEIAGTRAKMAVGDVATGLLLGGGAKAASKVVSPNPTVESGIFAQQAEAVKHFADQGVTLPRTPGEMTGINILLRGEAVARKLPGSAGTLRAVTDEQNAQMQRIQNAAMGLPMDATAADIAARPTYEQTGAAAEQALGSKVADSGATAQVAQQEVEETGTKEASALAGLAKTPVDTVAAGDAIRKAALAKREAFQAASAADYDKVYAHPLAQQRNLSADGLANEADKLLKAMPTKQVFTTAPSLMGPIRTASGEEVLKNWVPPSALQKLQDLSGLKGQQMRLGDLLKMRTDISNDIAQGEAIPGVDTGYLKKIRSMLTDTVDKELGNLPDPSLKKLWVTANENYAKGVKPFQKTGIAELFREPEQGSYLGEHEIVQRAITGQKATDTFRTYKDFFGPTSPEFTSLKRAVADSVVGNTKDSLSGMIDARQLVSNIDNLVRNNPQIATEVFGNKIKSLYAVADFMQAGQTKLGSIASKLEGSLRTADVQRAAEKGELTAQSLRTLVDQEKQYGEMLRNKVMRQISSGQFSGDHIKPSDFVNYFSTQADPKEISEVLSHLSDNPALLEDIRSKTAQQLFERAYPTAKAVDNPALLSGEPRVLTQEGLQNALGNETQRARYRAILGSDTYKDVEELTKFLAPRQFGEQSFAAAGGLAGGMVIAGMIRKGELKYASEAAKLWVLGKAYTSPLVRGWLQNNLISAGNSTKAARYMIASAPMVESLYREFPQRRAEQIAADLSASINRYDQEQNSERAKSDSDRRKVFEDLLKK